jgi:hypothetical protein
LTRSIGFFAAFLTNFFSAFSISYRSWPLVPPSLLVERLQHIMPRAMALAVSRNPSAMSQIRDPNQSTFTPISKAVASVSFERK